MILVIENRASLDRTPGEPFREHECSLQQTLRRMGFYAARPAPGRSRSTPAMAGGRRRQRRGDDDGR